MGEAASDALVRWGGIVAVLNYIPYLGPIVSALLLFVGYRLLGLPFPGGPHVDRVSGEGHMYADRITGSALAEQLVREGRAGAAAILAGACVAPAPAAVVRRRVAAMTAYWITTYKAVHDSDKVAVIDVATHKVLKNIQLPTTITTTADGVPIVALTAHVVGTAASAWRSCRGLTNSPNASGPRRRCIVTASNRSVS